ncbi:hypothetical protein Tdes44962_MAKER10062 [Teratosphaeria destructans]|uniref:Uncharacterized protein n=1 Tax=Teratosphaeria destructans TaxID=418781 RepID=A0A9W7SPJ3_9PEZI|nr:hypothetical protein Tdes44962_MAKER10062 [Teratosphaeria destructans]
MALHHQPEICNMRSAYSRSISSGPSVSSESDRSDRTGSVKLFYATTTSSTHPDPRQPRAHDRALDPRARRDDYPRVLRAQPVCESPRNSEGSVASTVLSEEDPQDREGGEGADYDVPEYTAVPYSSPAIPATPADFSNLFPSHRRMTIRHDDATLDGNMNLRVDTEVVVHDRKCDMTLFHLRMHDLKNRAFSLRRYCRDSGREVCRSERKRTRPRREQRPGLQRSLSNALTNMTIRSRSEVRGATRRDLKRNDSGYGSFHSIDLTDVDRPRSVDDGALDLPLDDTVRLEFSNYAQVDVKRAGVKSNKRYDFEYWGVFYSWKRIARKDGPDTGFTYRLTKAGSDKPLAFIMPLSLTPLQNQEEQARGGWISPCSMWLADESVILGRKDVVDAVVASGLMALVDDAIRTRFHPTKDTRTRTSAPKKHVSVDHVGPQRLIGEMFRRDSTGSHRSRPSTGRRPSTCSRPSTSSRPSVHSHGATSSRSTAGAVRPVSHQ